ncbi:ComEC/Rec2 family competence protein [Oricola indica]|uniref:ComEC/Rec2 family competence protein n=1 Tax=Oricola indica TaxID=2872591 RepID=UPI003CCC41A9
MTGESRHDTRTTTDERLFFRPAGEEAGQTVIPVVEEALPDAATPFPRPHLPRLPVPTRRSLQRAWRSATERERAVGTPFLFLPVGLLAGIVLYFRLPVEPQPWNLPVGLVTLALILFALRGQTGPVRIVAVIGFVIVAGMSLAQAQTWWTATPMLGSDVSTRLTGRITAMEERANGRTRFTIDVLKTERPALYYAPDRVRVTAPGSAEGFEVGGGIKGLVRLTSPSGPFHPGGYDFGFHAFYDGLGANGFFLGHPDPIEIPAQSWGMKSLATAVERARLAISREIQRSAPGREGAVAAALVTGNKSGIPESVTEALRVSGLAHILSISGLHMALVAATVMATLRLGFAFAPEWSARRPVKKYAAAGALAATGFYLFLAGAGVATQRSFAMLAIMLLALTFDRNAVTMRNLALAGLLVMAIAPHEVTGPGFQMSFAATAALIAVYGGWQDWTNRRERRQTERTERGPFIAGLVTLSRYAFGIAVTSLVAGAATGLFASYHFGRVAPYGLLANLAAMPVVTILVMPLAVAAMVVMPFGLHVYLFKAMAWAVGLVIAIAERVAAMHPPLATGQMPAAALGLLSLGLVILCLLTTRLRWLSLPFFGAGFIVWSATSPPVAVMSEDGRQFALIQAQADAVRLHTNRERPNAFTMELWQQAYRATDFIKPDESAVMTCDKTICSAQAGNARAPARIGYVSAAFEDLRMSGSSLETLCREYDLVIFAKAPSPKTCADGTPVLSAQTLALNGTAEIRLAPGGQVKITHALPGPVRPWLDHRRYSRAARDLADRR